MRAVRGDGKALGARPGLHRDTRLGAGGEAHLQAAGGERCAVHHFAHAVGVQPPHAQAGDAVETRVIEAVQGEGDIEIAVCARGHILAQIEKLVVFGDAIRPRRAPRGDIAGLQPRNFGEVAGRDLGARLHPPARLPGGVGKDADAKFLWKRAGGKLNYSRHTRIPSLR